MSIESIRAREAATPGPWSVSAWDGYLTVDHDTEDGIDVIPMDEANTAFIAHARQDIPALLRVAEAARAYRRATEIALEDGNGSDPISEALWKRQADSLIDLNAALTEVEALP